MTGTLFLVVGPSGSGKDTLIRAAAAARPDLAVPLRVVTRPADAPGERVESVSPQVFAGREAAGDFLLSWRAHGLCYGIPAQAAAQARAAGRDVIANVSRGVVDEARRRLQPVRVLLVDAPDAVLARRLAVRGREGPERIAQRLERARAIPAPQGEDVRLILNDGPLEAVLPAFLAALQPVRS